MRNIFKKPAILLGLFLFLAPIWAIAQTTTVSGIVRDIQGEPLIGVSVVEANTQNGTLTDIEGNYSIKVPMNSILVFTYVGFTEKKIKVTSSRLNVDMEENDKLLEEVVVVGYGIVKKSDVTGAISNINEKTLREVPVTNIAQSLQGRIAGVSVQNTSTRPGQASQIRIRGTRSLTASNDPLIIVDGIPFGGSMNDIAPDNIKSVDVLKDASATAIYGSRGANGVIIISTFRGVAGKPEISYNGYYGFADVSNKYKVFNAEEFIKYREISGYEAGSPYLTSEQQYFDTGKSFDWQDEMYQTATITNHDLNFKTGTEDLQAGVGLGYYDESSVLPGQGYTRYSLRGTIDLKMNNWLKIGMNTLNSYGETEGESASFMYSILAFSPLVNPYDKNGEIVTQPLAPREDAYSPLLVKKHNLWAQDRDRFSTINSLYAEVQIIPELKYRVNVGLNYSHDKFGEFYSSQSAFKSGGLSTASVSNAVSKSYAVENLLYFDKTFAQKHKLGLTAMYSVEDNYYDYSSTSATNMTADYMDYHNLGMNNNGVKVNADNQNYNRRVLLSYMGRINYSYDSKYLLTATIRRDGSSVLTSGNKWHTYPALSLAWNIKNESFMDKYTWMDMLKLRTGYGQTSNQSISPYATLGRLQQNKYNFGDELVNGYYPQNLVNTNLGWEYTHSYNAGIDFSVFKGRLSGSFDVYLQKTEDLLVGQSLPASSGVPGTIMVNVGETENKGMEFALHGDIIKPSSVKGFSWGADFNLYMNRNKLLKINSGVDMNEDNGWFVGSPIDVIYDFKKIGIWQLDEAAEAAKYNAQPGDIKIADIAGALDADGNPIPDGIISNADRSVIHKYEPDAELGFTNRFSYQDFDLTVVAFAQIGGTLVSTLHQGQTYLNTLEGRRNNIKVDYWTPTHPTNDHPKPRVGGTGQYASTLGYFDATYLKIRTITLGYTIPSKLLSKYNIKSLRAYVTCNNVATLFSPYMRDAGGVDPQATGYGGQGVAGPSSTAKSRQLTVGLNTPPSRQFLFGLSLKF